MSILPMTVTEHRLWSLCHDVTSHYNALERHHWSLAETENKLHSYCGDTYIDFGREVADKEARRLGLPGMQRALVVAEYYMEQSRAS